MTASVTHHHSLVPFTHYLEKGKTAAHYAARQLQNLYENASCPGETQKTVQSTIRTTVGVASIYFFPFTAAIAGTAASIKPDLLQKGCQIAEGAVTGFWNSLPFNAKIIVPAVGIAACAYYDPTALFKLAGIAFSAKLGAELGVRNYKKEHIAAITLEAKQANLMD